MFVSLRGSLPLTGDPHVSTGSTPGVDAGGIDRADPHALRVRDR
jgi:hypothetical protein